MNDNEQVLPDELQQKIDDAAEKIEAEEKKNSRFDFAKGKLVGLITAGLCFTFAIALRSGLFNAVIFALIGGVIGFTTGAAQRTKRGE